MMQTSGSITLEIGPAGKLEPIILDGQVGNQIRVAFLSLDGEKKFEDNYGAIVESVYKAFGASADFKTKLDELLQNLGGGAGLTGALGKVVEKLKSADLRLTDLQLDANYNEAQGKYVFQRGAFGFRVEFAQIELGAIKLNGFGVLFEYTEEPHGGGGVGSLAARPAGASR